MLGGQNDGVYRRRLAVDIAHGHLAFRVGPSLPASPSPCGGLPTEAAGCGGSNRSAPASGPAFRAGVTEHDALVARAFLALLVRGVVDALRDVGRLRMQENVDLGGLPVEAVLFIADVADRLARRGLELDGLIWSAPFLSFFIRLGGRRTSPAITTDWWWRASRRRSGPTRGRCRS